MRWPTRTQLMVESQTFIIMREPKAVAGAKRVTSDPKLQAVFRAAAAASGFPQDLLEAIAYLESWGDVSAESWAGSPRGIMQISLDTARTMGLKVGHVTRYRTVKVKVRVKSAARQGEVQDRQPPHALHRDCARRAPDSANAPFPPRHAIWRAWSALSADATGPSSPTTAARDAWPKCRN